MITHYAYAHEPPTRFGLRYAACGTYNRVQDFRTEIEQITCTACRQCALDEQMTLSEVLDAEPPAGSSDD
jgi:hypothetical protein